MSAYRVYFTTTMSTVVEVDAEDGMEAIDQAYDSDAMPSASICAQCSGWGQPWSRDVSGEWEPESVETADGELVWSEQHPVLTPEERVRRAERELEEARAALTRSRSGS